jgi:gamma-tubulin complex component 2
MSEKRTERTTVTTREKSVRRNPIKESSSAANRGDRDKSRPKYPSQLDGAGSGGPIREKDAVES